MNPDQGRASPMKLLVLGAGAVGGYFGGRAAQAGADVTFLVRPRRRAQLEREGLRIESPHGNATLAVQAVEASEVRPIYDVVLLSCKAYDLDSAMDAIAPAMAEHTVIVPLLNGMAHLARLDERFGAARVMGGTCWISATLDADGVIRQPDPLQRIAFGERGGTSSGPGVELAQVFAAAGVPCELVDNIAQEMWEKIAFLSVFAAATCLFRANIGEIVAAPGGVAALTEAFAVNCEAAARAGHPLRPAARERALLALTTASARNASMRHDLDAGNRVESDQVVGWMVEVARAHGLEPTLLAHAYILLKAYEARRGS
jgi:2-dehydropantoate 2-reductase